MLMFELLGKGPTTLFFVGLLGVIMTQGMSSKEYEELLNLGANGYRLKYGLTNSSQSSRAVKVNVAKHRKSSNRSDSKTSEKERYFMPTMFEM